MHDKSENFDLILSGGTCVTPGGAEITDIGVKDGLIKAIGDLGRSVAEEVFDVGGLHILPGVIDTQVHFREPGGENKEDFATGTAAAALGGVTGVFEMPNTSPATVDAASLADKCRRAKNRAWVNIAFYIGASHDNVEQLGQLERLPGCAGIKIFMGSSTGSLLVGDDKTLSQILVNGVRRCAVHAEDQTRLEQRFSIAGDSADVSRHPEWRDVETALRATTRLLGMARGAGRRVHVLHVSTAEEMDMLVGYRGLASVEVTPQHLSLAAPDAYERLGTKAQMNPPIRDPRHQEALWRAVQCGVVDVIGSDHAPHTIADKDKPYPQSPSGMPGVQTLVPVMLDHVAAGRLSLERFVDLTSAGAARIFGIVGKGRIAVGFDADLTIVDLAARHTISNMWIASKCGWTPYDGLKVTGWPTATVIGGRVVMREAELVGDPEGGAFRFYENDG